MKELILGTSNNFYNQKNDASYELLKKYGAKSKAINCFWNAMAMALEINGWINPKDYLWKKIQWTDYALMVQYNTKFLDTLESVNKGAKSRKLNEFPIYGKEIANKIIFGQQVVYYSENPNYINFSVIKEQIKNHIPVITSSTLYGGHFICYHGFKGNKLIYSDSYKDNGWYNEWTKEEFNFYAKKYMKLWVPLKNNLTYYP